ncbi:MAG TPA: hypothetical protein VG994_08245 [Steroidobacteraceae bacterium]|nr:hypothetical protein [Steroidobacteraceae bacterium]
MNDAPVLSSRLAVFVLLAIAWVAPVRAEPALYDFIRSHVDPVTGTLQPEALALPDESRHHHASRLRWAPGALEGLGTRHIKWDGSEKASHAARLLELIATGNEAAEPVLYDLLRADDVVTFYNDALDLAAARVRDPGPELHAVARRFVTESADRGAVKFGIAMLGSLGDARDLPVVQTLALHDEFGLYAAEAIAELAPDRQQALYEMARKLHGWGRIEAVSRMVATKDPALRRWLLTEGFRNTITPQYLAYQCATIADLAGALRDLTPQAKPDIPLLIGAADLIQSLVKPGPGAGFEAYDDAPQAATAFLQDIQNRREAVTFYLAAVALRDYVGAMRRSPEQGVPPIAAPDDTARAAPGPANDASARESGDRAAQSNDNAPRSNDTRNDHRPAAELAHWTVEQQRDVAALATRVVDDPSWRRHVVAAVLADDTDLDQAELAARKLDIKTFDLHLRRLSQHSDNARRWELAFAAAEPQQVKRLVSVAEDTSGAAREAVLHGVARYPGAGMEIVETSLANSDRRVRRAAVETLMRWGGPYLRNVSVRLALNDAARRESDDALKARIVALLDLGTRP